MANVKPVGWTDELLIREIRAGEIRRRRAWEYAYKAWRPKYIKPILDRGGTAEQVDSVLGYVCSSVERQILKPDFTLHSATLCTYFVKALINEWVREHKKNAKQPIILELETTYIDFEAQEEEDPHVEILNELINRMGEVCKQVLTLYRENYSMVEIAKKMGWKNEQSARNKKKECYNNLQKLAKKYTR